MAAAAPAGWIPVELIDLLAGFLRTDVRSWCRYVVPGIETQANFYCETTTPEPSSTVCRFEVTIHRRFPPSNEQISVIVDLGLPFGTGNMTFGNSIRRKTTFSPRDATFEEAVWSGLDDQVLAKAHEIAKSAHQRFAPPPSNDGVTASSVDYPQH